MQRVKFIVIEKSYLIRKGIVSIINRIEKASVVSELDNLNNFTSEINKHNPDFIVLNINLFKESEASGNEFIPFNIIEKGIAIVSSDIRDEKIINTFKEKIYLDDDKKTIFNKIKRLINESHFKEPLIVQNELSKREITILKLVARGMTNKEIADNLFLSAHTVITHRKNITNKLGIKTISGLVVYALLNNIITLDDIK